MRALTTTLLALSVWIALTDHSTAQQSAERYQPNWNSLSRHQTPQWLRDAKFGIYCHVSFETVKNLPGNESKHTHELIDGLTLDKFDAGQWADLFERAGAKFAGPVAWHGSGFLHWDSDQTPFNSANMGPRIDLIGQLKPEILARDMKLITSFHTGYWYKAATDQDNPGRRNPKYVDLYGPPHDLDVEGAIRYRNDNEMQSPPTREFVEQWLAKMNEAVNKYQPDISWLDTSFGGTVRAHNQGRLVHGKLIAERENHIGGYPDWAQRAYIANFFNVAAQHNKEVELVYKEFDIPPNVGMRNIENGLIDELAYDVWMTDIDICDPVSWFYKEGMGIKDANALIDILVDVVAKNGILLLNVPPKVDGTFSEDIVGELLEIGDWLDINGAAIYGTVPWTVYGEGPSFLEKTGHYSERHRNAVYTENDFRFTQKDDTLYAICLGVPKGEIKIRALGTRGRLNQDDIKSLKLLGSDATIKYSHDPYHLRINMPQGFAGKHACVFAIERAE